MRMHFERVCETSPKMRKIWMKGLDIASLWRVIRYFTLKLTILKIRYGAEGSWEVLGGVKCEVVDQADYASLSRLLRMHIASLVIERENLVYEPAIFGMSPVCLRWNKELICGVG